MYAIDEHAARVLMRFKKGNPGKRPRYNLYEIERLAKLGTPLAQLASKFGISYGYIRSVSCRQKWGIACVYGYKHRFRKGLPPSLAGELPQVEPAPPQPLQQAAPALAAPSERSSDWHRDFDQKWAAEIRANERAIQRRHTVAAYGTGYSYDANC
jgi:hypothetical protein